jgi:hypothetical protein
LRVPGGKGVVTTWSVVGDCGEHSTPLYLDARTFYDRGEYQSGITLLQYPVGAGHCAPGAREASPSSSSATPAKAVPVPAPAPATAAATAPSPAGSAALPAPAPAAAAPTPAAPASVGAPAMTAQSGEPPHLAAKIDTRDVISRSVQVYGTNGAEVAYRCSFTLVLGFSDGGSYQDHVKSADVRPGEQEAVVITRKYFKSVVKVDLTAQRCTAQ